MKWQVTESPRLINCGLTREDLVANTLKAINLSGSCTGQRSLD